MRIYASVMGVVLVAGVLCAVRSPAAESPPQIPQEMPILNLSLKDAIEAAVDKNPNVQLYKARIEAARSASITQLGALLPNLSGSSKFTNQTFFLGTIGGAPVRTPPPGTNSDPSTATSASDRSNRPRTRSHCASTRRA